MSQGVDGVEGEGYKKNIAHSLNYSLQAVHTKKGHGCHKLAAQNAAI